MAEGKVKGSVAQEVYSIRNILENTCKFTQEEEQLVHKKMDALKATIPCSGLGISEKERVKIVSAMGFPRGHWFNQLASEMDGAQHPAWSDTANNLMNFEEIRRMI
ncbi:NFX1-type zinc finger-containing protein 1 [Sciurus carolinensis]|uniref:NFX1-type zinc finger-containing protein 1 n=2 Tax=Sciurus carolinensis TaxID=30640 RepID=A0AA41MJJ7_SCICA|nr:NFX1-type zinc finger-containing protein 1 [Sciurus carolinensis]